LFLCLFLAVFSTKASAIFESKIDAGLVSAQISRKTLLKSSAHASPMGLGANYRLFVSERSSLGGNFSLNLGSEGVLLVGGGGGVEYNVIGGMTQENQDNYLKISKWPTMNLTIFGGMGAKSFDFTTTQAEETKTFVGQNPGTTLPVDGKDKATGSVFGLYFGFSADRAFWKDLNAGLRVQYFMGIAGETSPDINAIEIMIYSGFILLG
jgi:hypothetical protein